MYYKMNNQDPYTFFYSNIINQNNQNNILSENSINSEIIANDIMSELKIITIHENNINNYDKCPITLEQFKIGDSIVELHCNHTFSKSALTEWLKNNETCPMCRCDLNTHKSIEYKKAMDQYRLSHTIDSMIQFVSNRLQSNDVDIHNEVFEIY